MYRVKYLKRSPALSKHTGKCFQVFLTVIVTGFCDAVQNLTIICRFLEINVETACLQIVCHTDVFFSATSSTFSQNVPGDANFDLRNLLVSCKWALKLQIL